MRVRKKRPRPSGYEAEGFLCGPGDRPSRKKPSAKDAAEEWVRPDASRERMQNEIAAAKPRALTTKAQAGQEAAAAAAKQRLVASAPAGKRARRQAERDVERAVNGTLAAKEMQQSDESQDDWEPPSGKVLVDCAELEQLRRQAKLPPICAERAEHWSDEAMRAQTGFASVATFKSHLALFNSYFPQGIAPLYRGRESVAPQIEAAVRAKVEKASGNAPASKLDWYNSAADDDEWRCEARSDGRGKGGRARSTGRGRGRTSRRAQKAPAQSPAKASGGSKASNRSKPPTNAKPKAAGRADERLEILWYTLLGALPSIDEDPPYVREEEAFNYVIAAETGFDDRDELPGLVAQLRNRRLLLPGLPGEPIGLAVHEDDSGSSPEDSESEGSDDEVVIVSVKQADRSRTRTDPGLTGWERSYLYSSDIDDVRLVCDAFADVVDRSRMDFGALEDLPSWDVMLFADRGSLYRNGTTLPSKDFRAAELTRPKYRTVKRSDGFGGAARTMREFVGYEDGPLVASLKEYARRKSGQQNWKLELSEGTTLDYLALYHNRATRTDGSRTIDVLLEQQGRGFFQLNSGGNHWIAVLVDGAARYIGFFDSLHPGEDGCPDVLRSALTSALARTPGDWTVGYDLGFAPCGIAKLQNDTGENAPYQCGAWCLTAEECWLEFLRRDAQSRGPFGPWMREWLRRKGVRDGARGSSRFIHGQREKYRKLLLLRADYQGQGRSNARSNAVPSKAPIAKARPRRATSPADYSKIKVKDLREQCTQRGLESKGKKSALIGRLEQADVLGEDDDDSSDDGEEEDASFGCDDTADLLDQM